MLCMLRNVFEVAHHVGVCVCVCVRVCVFMYMYISMYHGHPVLSAGYHVSAFDLPTSG